MSRYSYSLPHSAEVVNIYMTNNIIEEPKYNKKETLKINETEFYYIEDERWKNIIMINDKAYIKFENKFIHRNKYDHQMLCFHCYDEDIYYVDTDEIEGYYSPTKLKINKEYKHNIIYISDYNLKYMEEAIKEIKNCNYENVYFGTLVKYSFSLKNGVYNDGDLLVYNNDVYYNIPLSLPLDVKLIEFKTIFGEVDKDKREAYELDEDEDKYEPIEDLDCEVSNDMEKYYDKLNDDRKKEFLINLIEDYTEMNNVLEGGACRYDKLKILFIFKEVIKMIPEYFNKLCDSFYCYNYFNNKIYFQEPKDKKELNDNILKMIPSDLKTYFNDFIKNINIFNKNK